MKNFIVIITLFLLTTSVWGQNVTILPGGITPAQSAAIEKLNYEQIIAKTDMQKGDTVFDTTFNCVRIYNGHSWLTTLTANAKGAVSPKVFASPNAEIWDITHDIQNNIYVVGYFVDSMVVSPTLTLHGSASFQNMFIIKYAPNGSVITTKQVVNSVPFSIKIDDSGNIWVAGVYSGTADFGGGNLFTSQLNGQDLFIYKYDSAFQLIWAKSEGGIGIDFPTKIETDASGNGYLTGYFTETIGFNNGALTYTSNGFSDAFLVKYNSSGVAQWLAGFGGTGDDFSNYLLIDNDDIYLTGGFESTVTLGSQTLTSTGTSSAFVIRYSTTGVFEQSNVVGGNGYAAGYGIYTLSSGSFVLLGSFDIDLNGASLPSRGKDDIFVAFIDSYGGSSLNINGISTYGSIDKNVSDGIVDVEKGADSNIYISGTSGGVLCIDGISTKVNNGTFVWKISANGENSLQSFRSDTQSSIPFLTADSLGNIYLSGFNNSPTTIGSTFLNTRGCTLTRVRMD